MKLFLIPALLLLTVAVVLSSGCTSQPQGGGGQNNGTTGGANSPPDHRIVIKNFAFDPPTVTVKSGDTVTWINEDSTPHIIASDPHPAHTDLPGLVSPELSQGQTYTFTYVKVGTWGYHCHVHPSMTGTVIVE
jgi:plastocyanin